jgi:hypothetical protein
MLQMSAKFLFCLHRNKCLWAAYWFIGVDKVGTTKSGCSALNLYWEQPPLARSR